MFTRVILDANVLASRTLRDWILKLQLESPGMFATLWTEDILAEAVRAVRRSNPQLDGGYVTSLADNIRHVMSERIDDFVVHDFSELNDEHDLHVHAAAIAGDVDMLVTHDTGFLHLPSAVARVTASEWEYWRRKNPSSDLPQRLRDAGCPDFAQRIWTHQRT